MTRNHICVSILAVCATAPAIGQTAGGPPIAYAKLENGGTNVYLTSPSGAGTVKLYSTPKKHTVGSLDLKPGGNEIAIIEYNGTLPAKLKIITFNNSGGMTGTPRLISAGVCSPLWVDYHPTQPKLILLDFCNGQNRIATIGTDGTGYTVLHAESASVSYRVPRWLPDGSHVYVRSSEQDPLGKICRDDCPTPVGPGSVVYLDVSASSNRIVIGTNSYISELDLDTGTLTSNIITGTDGHYSQNGGQILFKSPHDARGDYLHVWNRSDNTTPRITGKGEYWGKDWRK